MSNQEQNSTENLSAPTLWQVAKSVMAAAFGVQKKENLERDFKRGKASQFIILGIIFTVLFILGVWGLVSFVMKLAGI